MTAEVALGACMVGLIGSLGLAAYAVNKDRRTTAVGEMLAVTWTVAALVVVF